jgi:carbamoyltransferase
VSDGRDRYVLGLNAFHADAAAVLLDRGEVVCAIAEERVNRSKHFAGVPVEAVRTCLDAAGIGLRDVGHVAVARDGRAAFWRKVGFLASRPHRAFALAAPRLAQRGKVASVPDLVWQAVAGAGSPARPTWRVHRVEHHLAHAASAFFPSGLPRAAILTVDGFGDFSSTLLAVGEGDAIRVVDRVHFPHSLGVLYTMVSQFIGFDRYGDEGKVMGLAPYGALSYRDAFDEILVTEGGRFRLDLSWFLHHRDGSTYGVSDDGKPVVAPLWSPRMEQRFGPARVRGTPVTDRERDLARSLQDACERGVLTLAKDALARARSRDLCVAGGVALNSVANGRIVAEGLADRCFVQAAATDDGTALGAALHVSTVVLRQGRPWTMREAHLGPSWTPRRCEQALEPEAARLSWERLEDDVLVPRVADDLAAGRIVGWFQGREEWGPRALGCRSILADPRAPDMKERLNARVKHREAFRPFAPSVLEERTGEVFESSHPSPFMAHVYPVRAEWRARIPAVTHVDGTGRLQTVSRATHPRYHRLLSEFEARTGVPVVLNTSFNDDEPIVHRPEEAVACFLRTDMDRLALGPWYVRRRDGAPS